MPDADGIEHDFGPQPIAEPERPRRLAAVPSTVGQRLRAAREAQQLSQIDISRETRITQRHVASLERGDYDALPGRPYAIGFARTYARAVGLDEAAMVAAVRAELAARTPAVDPNPVQQFELGDPDKTPSRGLTWLALLLAVAVVACGMIYWRNFYQPAGDLPSLVQPEPPAPPPAPKAAPVAPPAPVAPATNPVVFTALEDGIWVKFYDGTGKQLLQKLLAKGETYTVPADAVTPMLWTGRPDALAITIGGQDVPRLADHQGVVRDVPVSGEALRARGQAPAVAPSAATSGAAAPGVAPSDHADGDAAPRAPHRRPRPAPAAAPVASDDGVDHPAADPVLPSN